MLLLSNFIDLVFALGLNSRIARFGLGVHVLLLHIFEILLSFAPCACEMGGCLGDRGNVRKKRRLVCITVV